MRQMTMAGLGLATLLACGGDDPTGPASMVGVYGLTTVNGQAVPVTVSAMNYDGGTIIRISSGVLTVVEDGTSCDLTLGTRVQPLNGPEQPGQVTTGCSLTRTGNTLAINLGPWGTHATTFERSNGVRSLTFDMGSGIGVLRFTAQ